MQTKPKQDQTRRRATAAYMRGDEVLAQWVVGRKFPEHLPLPRGRNRPYTAAELQRIVDKAAAQ